MFERILIPLDGSPRAEVILAQVSRILRRQDSEVLLLRVVNDSREEAEAYLREVEQRLSGRGARVRGRVAEGPVAAAILDVAHQERSTMIAMSTHGRGGLARWVLGSVAEKVARASEIPLLLVRSFLETPAAAPELPFRKILIPIDGSPTSLAAVEATAEFARQFESEVLVLHVWPIAVSPLYVAPGIPVFSTDPASIFPTPSPDKDPITAPAAERFRQSSIPVTRLSTSGDVASEILDQSVEKGVDLVALGTHGRSGVTRWVLGSVAERVLRHARTPILLVRSRPGA